MPEERPAGAPDILRLPCGALAAYPDEQSDRVAVFRNPASHAEDKELWFTGDDAVDGVQTGTECREEVETFAGLPDFSGGDFRDQI